MNTEDAYPLIVGITGLPGSGKTSFSEMLCDLIISRGGTCNTYLISNMIRDEINMRKMSISRSNMYLVGLEIRQQEGEGAWAERLIRRYITSDHSSMVIVDGIRTLGELNTFRNQLNSRFILISVDAPSPTLIRRIEARARYDDGEMQKNVLAMIEQEKNMGVNECMRLADYCIQNQGGAQELYEQVLSILEIVTLDKHLPF
ncbi:MAG: hypothetical protein DYG89_25450 [Caldilinea sp. CFX5]|nr:hypothetical protein [Caldilinea sp. CFX5]